MQISGAGQGLSVSDIWERHQNTSRGASSTPKEKINVNFLYNMIGETVRLTAEHYGVSLNDLMLRTRKREVSEPRMVAMYLLKKRNPKMTLYEISDYFGGYNHATVINALNKVRWFIETNREFRTKVQSIERDLESINRSNMTLHVKLSEHYALTKRKNFVDECK